MRLVPATDRQRNTRFRYGRCPRGHGRFITFFDFLREKDFVRTLSAQQVAELRAQVQTVNCSNCGAPIDLAATSSCGHCGSPLSMLDMRQADALIAQLRAAATAPAAVSPTLPLDLLMARREAERACARAVARPGRVVAADPLAYDSSDATIARMIRPSSTSSPILIQLHGRSPAIDPVTPLTITWYDFEA